MLEDLEQEELEITNDSEKEITEEKRKLQQ